MSVEIGSYLCKNSPAKALFRNMHTEKQIEQGIYFGMGITDEHMRCLEGAFSNPRSEREFRDRAIFMVLSRTGLRASGLLSLRWSAGVTTPEGKIAFAFNKKGGSQALTIPGAHTLRAVRDYHESIGTNVDSFFWSLPNRAHKNIRSLLTVGSLERIVRGWGETFNIRTGRFRLNNRTHAPTNSLRVHAFRHTCIQKIFDQAGSIAAQKLAQHQSPVTTSRFYTRPYFDGSEILQWNAG